MSPTLFRAATTTHTCQPPMRCAVYTLKRSHDDLGPMSCNLDNVSWRLCTGFHNGYGCLSGEATEPIRSVWICPKCDVHWIVWLRRNHPSSRLWVDYRPTWRRTTWWERRKAHALSRRTDAKCGKIARSVG